MKNSMPAPAPVAVAAAPVAAKPFNMSEACRNWFKTHPKSSPKECVEALKSEGVSVSSFIAQQVRYTARQKRRAAANQAWATRTANGHNVFVDIGGMPVPVADLRAAKEFAEAHGGVKRLRQLLDALAQLGI